jgi:hypothetical protein
MYIIKQYGINCQLIKPAYLVKMFIICSEFSAESMQGYDTSLLYLNWIQVYQLTIDTILFYDIQVKKIILLLLTYL